MSRKKGVRLIETAMGALAEGRVADAERLAEAAVDEFAAMIMTAQNACDFGCALRVLADVQVEKGCLDAAYELLAIAEEAFSAPEVLEDPTGQFNAVSFYHDTAILFLDHGNEDQAATYLELAHKLAQGHRDATELVEHTRRQMAFEAASRDPDRQTQAIEMAWTAVQTAPDKEAWVIETSSLITALWTTMEPANVRRGAEWFVYWWPRAQGQFTANQLTSPLVAYSNHLDTDCDVVGFTQTLQAAVRLSLSEGSTFAIQHSMVALATHFVATGRTVEGFWLACEALVRISNTADEQATTRLRAMAASYSDRARRVALCAAASQGWHTAVAELIEDSRLQALIDVTGEHELETLNSFLPGLGVGRREVSQRSFVSVSGRSVLADAARVLGFSKPTVDLDQAFVSESGQHRSWFGAWLGCGSTATAYRSLDGTWDSRFEHEFPFAAMPGESSGFYDAESRKGARQSPQNEQAAMIDIADALTPDQMRRDLLLQAREGTPRQLAVAADRLIPLVALPTMAYVNDQLGIVRILHGFDPVIVPPELIRQAFAVRDRTASGPDRCLFAVLDPTGDLDNSRLRHNDTRIVAIGNRGPSDTEPAGTVADIDHVCALIEQAAERGGMFVFAGHSVADEDDPSLSALVLMDGPLSARDLVTNQVNCPPASMLSSCSSSGGSALLTGEWSGLPAAFMGMGCRDLVVTGADLPDTGFTSDFENDVWADWLNGTPLPKALRRAQLAASLAWSQQPKLTELDLVIQAESVPTPEVWGVYYVVGL